MYNVLIVDDEPSIREGLRIIIPWDEYGYKVVDVATSGMDALEKYMFHDGSIDVMLVDIQMPGMDGLELIEKIREKNNKLHFVIVSGYAEFSYAKRALVFGVEDYILKPINEDELINCLVKLKDILTKEDEDEVLLNKNIAGRTEQLISNLLSKGDLVGNHLKKEAKDLGLSWNSYQVLLLKDLNQNGLYKKELEVKELLLDSFHGQDRGHAFIFSAHIGILLNKKIANNRNLKSLYNELMGLIKKYGDFCITAGLEVTDLAEISKSFETAQELLKRKFFYNQNVLICSTTPMIKQLCTKKDGEKFLKNENNLVDKLVYAIKIGNRDVVLKIIEQDILYLIQDETTENSIKEKYIQFVSSVLTKLISYDSRLSWLEEEFPKLIVQIYNYTNFEQLETCIKELFTMILKEMKTDSKEIQIEKLFEFIHENYNKNIKLEMLAEIFNYSSAYLGKLFKNATRESFNTYLDKVRIEKAKELLKKGIKVYQVAELVGYTNVDYFFSKFKKYVGVSPSTYKKEAEKELV